MDHRWDDATWQDRASRGERERFRESRISRDPDVERRDQLREEERRASINQSPWSIGVSYWDQRDTYTRNSRIDERGYARGPSQHPEQGSYAYPRHAHHADATDRPSHASLHEREAWPWLNYRSPDEDPYFAHLQHHEERGLWDRLKETLHVGQGKGPKNAERSDARIHDDVADALTYRGDLDATDIEVKVVSGEVTLEGTVPDRRSKRVAEEVAEGIRGVRDVHNRLTIRTDEPTDADVAFVLPLATVG